MKIINISKKARHGLKEAKIILSIDIYLYMVYILHINSRHIFCAKEVIHMILLQNSGVPIYQQIAEQLEEDILAGRLKEGEYLPSIRGLAKELKISVITTMKAYELLAQEGLVTAMQGKGFYVNAQDSEMLREQHLRRVEDALAEAIAAAKIAGLDNRELMETLQVLLDSGTD